MADFGNLAAGYLAAVRAQDEAAEVLAAKGEAVKVAERAMFDAMADAEISDQTIMAHSFKIDVATRYSCLAERRLALYEALKPYDRDGIFKTTLSADMKAEEAEAMRSRLIAAGVDDAFCEKFTVHAGTLQAAMREWDDGCGIPPEVKTILSVYDEPRLVVKPVKR